MKPCPPLALLQAGKTQARCDTVPHNSPPPHLQAGDPQENVNIPGGHAEHSPESGESADVPGGHSWQLGASREAVKVPLGQIAHACSGEGGQLALRPPSSWAWSATPAALAPTKLP